MLILDFLGYKCYCEEIFWIRVCLNLYKLIKIRRKYKYVEFKLMYYFNCLWRLVRINKINLKWLL